MNKVARQKYRRIFLLSHMRSFSSLIGHILGSHPYINGYYEMHLSYSEQAHLDDQLRLYMRSESLKPESFYLFDKLLHNDYQLDAQLLERTGSKVLLSIRSPENCLRSILHLFQSKQADDLYEDPAQVTDYYIERLKALAEFSRKIPGQYYYFDAELIKRDSRKLLNCLTDWCQLTPALSDRYQTFSLTGEAGAGDSSSQIKSGRIEVQENRYSEVYMGAEHIISAQKAYAEYRDDILGYAKDSLTL